MKLHDVVALMRDVEENALVKGQMGKIVGQWQDGVYEVEVADMEGRNYANAALPEEVLFRFCFSLQVKRHDLREMSGLRQ